MWQKKENGSCESISIEEYLVKRKEKRKESEAERVSSLLLEGGQWILTELYM